MLISGSSLTALSLFSQCWFPHLPLWSLTAIYAGFGEDRGLLALVKISAIVLFIILALSV